MLTINEANDITSYVLKLRSELNRRVSLSKKRDRSDADNGTESPKKRQKDCARDPWLRRRLSIVKSILKSEQMSLSQFL